MSTRLYSQECLPSSATVPDAGGSSQPASHPPPAEYPNVPIDPAQQIRILKLEGGEYGDQIHCQLSLVTPKPFESEDADSQWIDARVSEKHDPGYGKRYMALWASRFGARMEDDLSLYRTLLAPHDSPVSYEALSYTWGSWEQYQWIVLEGLRFPVTKSLWAALQNLRYPRKSRRLWIDQICINQSSVSERNQQIQMMGTIYQCSLRVVVWLGELSEDTINQILPMVGRRFSEPITLTSPLESEAIQIALGSIMMQPSPRWWERVWVIQESVKAPDLPTYLCGPFEIDHVSIEAEIRFWKGNWPVDLRSGPWGPLHTLWRFIQDVDEIRLLERKNELDMMRLASVWTSTASTDPRDKVYGLLNLLPVRDRSLIIPNYDTAISSLFSETTYASVVGGSYDILVHITLDPQWRIPNLPSWTIDFQNPKPHHSSIYCPRRYEIAAIGRGEDEHRFMDFECPVFDPQNFRLTVKGVEFDKVAAILPVLLRSALHQWRLEPSQAGPDLHKKWETEEVYNMDEKKLLVECARTLASNNCCHDSVYGQLDEEASSENLSSLRKTIDKLRRSLTIDRSASIEISVAALLLSWLEVLGADTMTLFERCIWVKKCYAIDWLAWEEYFHFVSDKPSALFVTEMGFLGICPGHVEEGDRIVLSGGMRAPLILRQTSTTRAIDRCQDSLIDSPQTWSFRGFSFVNGLMGTDCFFSLYLDHLRQRVREFVLV